MSVTVTNDSPLVAQVESPVIVVNGNDGTVVTDGANYIIDAGVESVTVIPSLDTHTVVVNADSLVTIAAGTQGPQGIRGPIGLSGAGLIELTAGMDVGGNRVVTGSAEYADNTDLSTIGRIIGITVGAALSGSLVNIMANGELDGFYGLTVNEPVYLSTNGTITQALPTAGYLQKLGVAISATSILINISNPWVL